MTFEEFSKIFIQLRMNEEHRSRFISSIPHSIRDAFFDNDMVDSLYNEVSFLLGKIFDGPLKDDIDYFLTPSDDYGIIKDDNEYMITSEEDMLEYFRKEYDWKEQ